MTLIETEKKLRTKIHSSLKPISTTSSPRISVCYSGITTFAILASFDAKARLPTADSHGVGIF